MRPANNWAQDRVWVCVHDQVQDQDQLRVVRVRDQVQVQDQDYNPVQNVSSQRGRGTKLKNALNTYFEGSFSGKKLASHLAGYSRQHNWGAGFAGPKNNGGGKISGLFFARNNYILFKINILDIMKFGIVPFADHIYLYDQWLHQRS